jgi:N6-L-threonylcarbamoyladenine synthase/protein kinase Bud32
MPPEPGEAPRRVLGVEGTAWAASAAIYDGEREAVVIESDAYQPDSGGIHPREAAEHMQEAIPQVVETALEEAAGRTDERPPVDCVAFSRGPGLGPCLRVAGTAARSVAQVLEVPLVGVNHMVAHLEIGRQFAEFESPVCLNASGANAHVLGYNGGRYRVLGETMDTGVGNAIDKFTRHLGWSHPGGPKVEAAAAEGEYVELPYVVKGMDFSFAGLGSAARAAVDEGDAVEDVCAGLQETVFAMLTEVSERALSLTASDELVVGGGVAQNRRLQGMLREMCDERGADFFVPEDRFLRDNAGMIAVLGARMFEAGDTVAVDDSTVRPAFRPDEVEVTWRGSTPRNGADDGASGGGPGGAHGGRPQRDEREVRGAEAVVTVDDDRVVKRRVPKVYRHPELDATLRRDRTVMEARLTSAARRHGVPTPVVRDVDVQEATLVVEHVGDCDLGGALSAERVRAVGRHLAAIHAAGFVHGDPTTRNVRVGRPDGSPDARAGTGREPIEGEGRVFLIDFGLGFHSDDVEDHAMDCHVFEQSLDGTARDPQSLRAAFEDGYRAAGDERVLDHLRSIERRGRYQ